VVQTSSFVLAAAGVISSAGLGAEVAAALIPVVAAVPRVDRWILHRASTCAGRLTNTDFVRGRTSQAGSLARPKTPPTAGRSGNR
jgi:hypothetical protein